MNKGNFMGGFSNMLLVFCSFLLLTGCSKIRNISNDMKNVEERDYATILMVSDGEKGKKYQFALGIAQEKKVGEKSQIEEVSKWDCNDLVELAEEYQMVKGKDLSLAHLKVILVSMEKIDIMDSATKEMFLLLDYNEEIAKTCPVLHLPKQKEFLEFLEESGEPVGGYLENLIRAEEKQGGEVPWLKDYLKAIREKSGLEMYFLRKESEGWKVNKSGETE